VTYLLDNLAPATGGRFAGLEACFDETTFRPLTALGIAPGWRCWELGAGGGSVVRWMAAQVHRRGASADLQCAISAPEQDHTIDGTSRPGGI
jgi:hypothetical protein